MVMFVGNFVWVLVALGCLGGVGFFFFKEKLISESNLPFSTF